jgi:preprotein translocase subunit SecG
MTLKTNARLAGIMFLLYIATGIVSMIVFRTATAGGDAAARLASIAQNETLVRITVLLTLLTFVYAIVLGVTMYALTRDEDRDLAVLSLAFRAAEGTLGAAASVRTMGLIAVAKASLTASGTEAAALAAQGSVLLGQGGSSALIAATAFTIASLIYSWLFFRARSIPVWLSVLGVVGSLLLAVALPVQIAGFLPSSLSMAVWMPMLVFEVVLAGWLIFKGVRSPARTASLRAAESLGG